MYILLRKLDNLIEDLEVILDTPSKRTLWSHIIPLLTKPHQEATQLMLKEKDSGLSGTKHEPLLGYFYFYNHFAFFQLHPSRNLWFKVSLRSD